MSVSRDGKCFVDPTGSPAGDSPPNLLSMPRIAQHLYESVSTGASHQRAKQQAAASTSGKAPAAGHRPNFLVCYLCGQQFSRNSLAIHQPQCFVKRVLEWERTGMHGPKPLHPQEVQTRVAAAAEERGEGGAAVMQTASYSTMTTRAQVDAFNTVQGKVLVEDTMVPCDNCGRTFFPDRLVVHLRSCRPGNAAKPVRAMPATSRGVPPVGAPSSAQRRSPPQHDPGSAGLVRPPLATHETHETAKEPIEVDDELEATAEGRRDADESTTPTDCGSSCAAPAVPESAAAPSRTLVRDDDDDDSLPRRGAAAALRSPDRRAEKSAAVEPEASPPHRDAANAWHSTRDAERPSAHASSTSSTAILPEGLVRCRFCHRTFAEDRIAKHEDVCLEKRPASANSRAQRKGPVSAHVHPTASHSHPSQSGYTSRHVHRVGQSARVVPVAHRSVDSRSPTSLSASRDDLRSPDVGTGAGYGRPGSASSHMRSTCGGDHHHQQQQQHPSAHNPAHSSSGASRQSPVVDISAAQERAGLVVTPPFGPGTAACPKFCTECGHRLYSSTQKFCGECGTRVAHHSQNQEF